MKKYVCEVCGWEYDPEVGCPEANINPGTPWEEVPEDFECPLCSVGKDQFVEEAKKMGIWYDKSHQYSFHVNQRIFVV